MNYCSRTRVESALKNEDGELLYPGVSFVISKMNERRRVKRELQIAELRTKVNEQSAALQAALKDKDNQPPGAIDRLNATFGELLHGEWYPAWIRWGVFSIEGLEIDDVPATVATLCESGPSDLVEEIFMAVLAASGLSTPETKNLQQPGISEDQADGKTISSIAASAGSPDGILSATAPSTSPAP